MTYAIIVNYPQKDYYSTDFLYFSEDYEKAAEHLTTYVSRVSEGITYSLIYIRMDTPVEYAVKGYMEGWDL